MNQQIIKRAKILGLKNKNKNYNKQKMNLIFSKNNHKNQRVKTKFFYNNLNLLILNFKI